GNARAGSADGLGVVVLSALIVGCGCQREQPPETRVDGEDEMRLRRMSRRVAEAPRDLIVNRDARTADGLGPQRRCGRSRAEENRCCQRKSDDEKSRHQNTCSL